MTTALETRSAQLAPAAPATAIATLAPQATRAAVLTSTEAVTEYLSFRLGGEEYGVDILRVQEIRSYEAPTRIANAPDYIKGVVNLRGLIVPIVDLRLKLNCGSAEYNDLTIVIVLNIRNRVIGAVVDAVSEVVSLGLGDIKPAPQLGHAIGARYITGLGCIGSGDAQRMLILTDIDALMSSEEMGLMS